MKESSVVLTSVKPYSPFTAEQSKRIKEQWKLYRDVFMFESEYKELLEMEKTPEDEIRQKLLERKQLISKFRTKSGNP